MVLESTVICVDNSDFMRNGDFIPTRIQAQHDAVNLIVHSKLRSNPENNVALLTLANVQVLATLTSDAPKLLSKLHDVQPNGDVNLLTGIRVAHLALKHRQGKNHRMRIVVFLASPLESDEKELIKLAKRLKKEKVNVDVVNFGEEQVNTDKLNRFVEAINGKEGTGSRMLTVSGGSILADALYSSAIVQGEDGAIPPGLGGTSGFEFGVNPDDDPELAMALRISMEEQRQRQEADARRVQAESAEAHTTEVGTDDAMLNQALAMSMQAPESRGAISDYSALTEDEQIALAMQMSLQESQSGSSSQPTPMDAEDAEGRIDDPEYLQRVLGGLPGVDPNSEEVRNAMASLMNPKKDKADKEDKK